jgi:hypothetical protein
MKPAVINVRRRLTRAPRKRLGRMHFQDPEEDARRAHAGTKVLEPRVAGRSLVMRPTNEGVA